MEQYLYDLQADPYELTNLIGLESHQEVASVMRERMVRRMVAAGEEAPAIEPAPVRRTIRTPTSGCDSHTSSSDKKHLNFEWLYSPPQPDTQLCGFYSALLRFHSIHSVKCLCNMT